MAYEVVMRKIRFGIEIDAIMCLNDDMVVGVNRVLHELGVRIPDDIALVGCDDVVISEYLHPSHSTIEHPSTRVCSLAWEFLHNRIQNPDEPAQQVILAARFIPRASTEG